MTTTTYPDARFRFWRGYLLVMTILFAVQAVSWPFFGSFDPFGFYDGLLAGALFKSDTLPAEGQRVFAFATAPLGATTAGFFMLMHGIVRFAFPRREPWAWWTVATALAGWFLLDSAFSVLHGVVFNVWLVNVPCLVLLGIALGALWPAFRQPST